MRSSFAVAALISILIQPPIVTSAQEPSAHPARSPYADLMARDIKGLSDQRIEDLKAGRGMSMALVGELNGYPGPMHTLELADGLSLTANQRAQTENLLRQMRTEAIDVGNDIIAREAAIDVLFKQGRPRPDQVEQATVEIAQAEGRLRAIHLRYHLQMMDVLDPQQIAQYAVLRGYQTPMPNHQHPH
jgi:Spy/CpxP family protein refolding chaperone